MRIRTIKPEFWQNEDIAQLADSTKLVAIGLLNVADDEGFFKAHAKLIESQLFPFSDPSVSVHTSLSQLAEIGYIELKKGSDGKDYGRVVNFEKHQVVNRPKPSVIKEFCQCSDESLINHGAITAGKEGKGREKEQGKEEEGNAQAREKSSSSTSENEKSIESKIQKEKAPPGFAAPPHGLKMSFMDVNRFSKIYQLDIPTMEAAQMTFKQSKEIISKDLEDFIVHRQASSKPTDTYEGFCRHFLSWKRKRIEHLVPATQSSGGRNDFMKDY